MISLNAHAKINLSLDVLSRREDGYHNLQMIMQTIQLHDTVNVSEIQTGIEIQCQAPYVPNNSSNIAYKAAELLLGSYKINKGVRIVIEKKIPVAAGLAGGSSDAAAVLKGINTLFNLGIELSELMKIGKTIGADVPYCLLGGTALAEGIGEKLTPIKPLENIPVVLVKPKIGVSTAWVYKNLNLDKISNRPDTKELITAIEEGNITFVAENMSNVLESVTAPRYPIIDKIKKDLTDKGAIGSMMSGSGPTVFGIFENSTTAQAAKKALNIKNCDVILTHIKNV